MFSRRYVMLFAVVSVVILGTGFFTAQHLARELQTQLQTETNRLAYSRVLLSTRLLGDAVLNNHYDEIKQVIDGLGDDSEISCVQYRDGVRIISSRVNNEPCQPTSDDGLFSMTLSEEHAHDGEDHNHAETGGVQKKILEVSVKGEHSRRLSEKVKVPFLILGIEFLVALMMVILYFSLSSRALSQFLVGSFRKIALGETVKAPKSILLESEPIAQSLAEIEKNLLEYQRLVSERVESEVLVKVASQVSHDVRAPLGAMELIVGSLDHVPADQKEILRNAMKRIRDISDSLLSKQNQVKNFVSTTDSTSAEPLNEIKIADAIDEIVHEKRVGLSPSIQIQFDSHSDFKVKVQLTEFKRILSNLLNNSIEAMQGRKGLIILSETVDSNYTLTLRDQGVGIKAEDLSRLGQFGVTVGKEGGKGIGLHHAMQTLRSWGGSLTIESEVDRGTTVSITLPFRAQSESWTAWQGRRVMALGLSEKELNEVRQQSELIHAFDSAIEFKKYYGTNFADLDEVIFLLHSSQHNQEMSEVVQELGLNSQISYFS